MIREQKFYCMRDDLQIEGMSFLPEGKQLPVVIISHGFTRCYDDHIAEAREFAEIGFAVFIYDFNGGGAKTRSDKDSTKMSVLTEIEDLKSVIEYTRTVAEADKQKLYLLGYSQGGFVSAVVAAQLKAQIEKIVMYYPALSIPDGARSGKMIDAVFDPENIPEVFTCAGMKLGRVYAESMQNKDPICMIRDYAGPVLILQGDQDDLVDVSYAKKAFETYENAELFLIHGAGHGFSPKQTQIAMGAVKAFLTL